jgi:hypothetical protein
MAKKSKIATAHILTNKRKRPGRHSKNIKKERNLIEVKVFLSKHPV